MGTNNIMLSSQVPEIMITVDVLCLNFDYPYVLDDEIYLKNELKEMARDRKSKSPNPSQQDLNVTGKRTRNMPDSFSPNVNESSRKKKKIVDTVSVQFSLRTYQDLIILCLLFFLILQIV